MNSRRLPGRRKKKTQNSIPKLWVFPTFAYPKSGGDWNVQYQAWAFETTADSALRKMGFLFFRRFLGITAEQARSQDFRKKALPFVSESIERKRFATELGSDQVVLPQSQSNGHISHEFVISQESFQGKLKDRGSTSNWLSVRTKPHAVPGSPAIAGLRAVRSQIQFLNDEGISVISDIDDTIKKSEVWNKKQLLINSFVKEYQSVPGMATAYQRWAKEGACFHYVSTSPWQIWESLEQFRKDKKFPAGSFHLKTFSWSDSTIIDLFASPAMIKTEAIYRVISKFRKRKFVLVGDSGEFDPEIYGKIAKEFPSKIAGIYIRLTRKEDSENRRFEKAFKGLPKGFWRVFEKPKELPNSLL